MKTKDVVSEEKEQLIGILKDVINNLTGEQTSKILKASDLVKSDLNASINKHLNVDIDKRFGRAIKEFEFTVPLDYDYYTQIDFSIENVKSNKTTYFCNNHISGSNFTKTTNKLIPGKIYKVKIFPILESVTNDDCLTFLHKHNALLVGGQGTTLVYDVDKDQFPKDKWIVSLDEKDSLWKDPDGDHGIIILLARYDGKFGLEIRFFEKELNTNHYLICFTN